MSNIIAFMRKEKLEYIRTHKLILLLAIFIVLGILSPMMAKLTPEIIKSVMDENIAAALKLSEPTAFDSYTQFFKNMQQIALITLVLICSSMLCAEVSKGTLIPLVSKGLHRSSIILSKFFVSTIIWTICYSCCFLITSLYTTMLFPPITLHALFPAIVSFWLFGVLLLALILLASSFLHAAYGVLMFVVFIIVVLFLCNFAPAIQKYNPLILITVNLSILQGRYELTALCYPVITTTLLIIATLCMSCYIFQKKQL